MFSCGALIQSQSYRGGHAQIGRDRQRLKKERKIRRHEHQDMHNVSLLFVEVLGLGIFRASDMLYKCLPTIRTSLYGRKIGANVYIHDVASSPGLSSS